MSFYGYTGNPNNYGYVGDAAKQFGSVVGAVAGYAVGQREERKKWDALMDEVEGPEEQVKNEDGTLKLKGDKKTPLTVRKGGMRGKAFDALLDAWGEDERDKIASVVDKYYITRLHKDEKAADAEKRIREGDARFKEFLRHTRGGNKLEESLYGKQLSSGGGVQGGVGLGTSGNTATGEELRRQYSGGNDSGAPPEASDDDPLLEPRQERSVEDENIAWQAGMATASRKKVEDDIQRRVAADRGAKIIRDQLGMSGYDPRPPMNYQPAPQPPARRQPTAVSTPPSAAGAEDGAGYGPASQLIDFRDNLLTLGTAARNGNMIGDHNDPNHYPFGSPQASGEPSVPQQGEEEEGLKYKHPTGHDRQFPSDEDYDIATRGIIAGVKNPKPAPAYKRSEPEPEPEPEPNRWNIGSPGPNPWDDWGREAGGAGDIVAGYEAGGTGDIIAEYPGSYGRGAGQQESGHWENLRKINRALRNEDISKEDWERFSKLEIMRMDDEKERAKALAQLEKDKADKEFQAAEKEKEREARRKLEEQKAKAKARSQKPKGDKPESPLPYLKNFEEATEKVNKAVQDISSYVSIGTDGGGRPKFALQGLDEIVYTDVNAQRKAVNNGKARVRALQNALNNYETALAEYRRVGGVTAANHKGIDPDTYEDYLNIDWDNLVPEGSLHTSKPSTSRTSTAGSKSGTISGSELLGGTKGSGFAGNGKK